MTRLLPGDASGVVAVQRDRYATITAAPEVRDGVLGLDIKAFDFEPWPWDCNKVKDRIYHWVRQAEAIEDWEEAIGTKVFAKYADIREQAALHPNAPEFVLDRLANDEDENIRAIVAARRAALVPA